MAYPPGDAGSPETAQSQNNTATLGPVRVPRAGASVARLADGTAALRILQRFVALYA
jgi:hypothetical protein